MINQQVQVTAVKTMADGTIRLTIDLLNGSSEDISEAYKMVKNGDSTILLSSTSSFIEDLTNVGRSYITELSNER